MIKWDHYIPEIGKKSTPIEIHFSEIDYLGGLLVRSPNWLGDACMTLPAVYKIRTLLPKKKRLAILCPAKLISFWQSVPWVDVCIPFAGRRLDKECQKKLIHFNPGISIVLPNSFGSARDLKALGLTNLVGRKGRGRKMYLDHRLPSWKRNSGRQRTHESKKYLEFATSCGYLGWDLDYPSLTSKMSFDKDVYVKELFESRSSKVLVLAPGAAYGPAKQWPTKYFHQVAHWWSQSHGFVIAVGTVEEKDTAGLTIKNCSNSINIAGRTTVAELMGVLSRATCVLANDSGTMHLAAALGKNGVAIFGSTDPIATGPIGGKWILLNQDLSCSPCQKRSCYRKDHPYECLTSIDPESVIQALQGFLSSLSCRNHI